MSITLDGCPSAAARLIKRPSPRTLILLPSCRVYSSTKVLIFFFFAVISSSPFKSSSTLKCPELLTIAPSFIILKCSFLITLIFPVTVQKISPVFAASSIGITRNPSITASRALRESTSVTITLAPIPLERIASPRPHQP